MKSLILFLLLSAVLSACSSTYTCQKYPTGGCKTVSAVYKESNGATDTTDTNDNSQEESKTSVSVNKNAISNPLPNSPLLGTPEVLRVFINHWEDEEGDLHVGGHIFVKIKDAKWNI